MSRLATSFVLGYHGCDEHIARKAVLDGDDILHSNKDYDWLGPGAYFWEADPQRALEWAKWKTDIGQYKSPAVVGAVIDLRNCLDLVSREDLEIFKEVHRSFVSVQKKAGLDLLPWNVLGLRLVCSPEKETENEAFPFQRRADHRYSEGASGRFFGC